jgi:hypothetical protein
MPTRSPRVDKIENIGRNYIRQKKFIDNCNLLGEYIPLTHAPQSSPLPPADETGWNYNRQSRNPSITVRFWVNTPLEHTHPNTHHYRLQRPSIGYVYPFDPLERRESRERRGGSALSIHPKLHSNRHLPITVSSAMTWDETALGSLESCRPLQGFG